MDSGLMAGKTGKQIHIQYYALMREKRGCSAETLISDAQTPAELYAELDALHNFSLPGALLRVAVNDEFADMDRPLEHGDIVIFIPPVAGG